MKPIARNDPKSDAGIIHARLWQNQCLFWIFPNAADMAGVEGRAAASSLRSRKKEGIVFRCPSFKLGEIFWWGTKVGHLSAGRARALPPGQRTSHLKSRLFSLEEDITFPACDTAQIKAFLL
jgi:hypothetical protein